MEREEPSDRGEGSGEHTESFSRNSRDINRSDIEDMEGHNRSRVSNDGNIEVEELVEWVSKQYPDSRIMKFTSKKLLFIFVMLTDKF